MAITPRHDLLTVDEYHALVERGVLDEDSRVELVNGILVEMPPIGPRHTYNVNRLTEHFLVRLLGRMTISIQNPVVFGRRLERYPDIALLKRQEPHMESNEPANPTPPDVLLLVEVSDSTLHTDLVEKAQQYAEHRVADYWVVDLQGDRVVVHREPTPNGYDSVQSMARGESISPLAFADVTFSVDEILG
jgi:Uma2 family endonuclease